MWDGYSRKLRKAIILIIIRAQKPVQLTAQGLIDVNIRTFYHVSMLGNEGKV